MQSIPEGADVMTWKRSQLTSWEVDDPKSCIEEETIYESLQIHRGRKCRGEATLRKVKGRSLGTTFVIKVMGWAMALFHTLYKLLLQ